MALPSPLRQRKLTWIVEIGEYPPYRTGPYEEHLNYSKNEREDVQKKTFAKWINSQLAKNGKPPVDDLFQDLRDGEVLLSLLEILTGQQFKRERGHMRVHHLNNVNAALRLVWSIILHWQVHYHLKELMSELQQTNLEKTLLSWCRNHTESYAGVNVTNFTTSWSDGLAFNALLHRWRPHLFDFDTLVAESETRRLEHAFSLAHTHLGIDRLLDPEDVNTPNPDKKSIMMYVMCLFQSLPTPDTQPLTEAALAANNEKFLLDLSEQQWRVGAVLEEGARLIRDAALTKDEANEVRLQMRLLNSRWEELRVRAMERQSELHAKLMKAQHTHLDNFREWLTKTEDRMSRMETAQQSAGEALEAAQQLHAELRTQQPLVDALADCVVVVDDEMEHDTSVTEIEDQLRALGERWSHACQWIVQRLQRLQGLQALHERGAQLKSDADALETELKQMETYPVSEIGEVLERISQLQRCKHSISVQRSAIAEHLQRLPALEEASFSEAAEELNDRLDALEMILMVQVDRIKELGFEVDMNSDAQTDTSTVTTTLTLHASKKPRLSAPDFQCMNKLESSGRSEELIEVIQRVQKESSSQATDFAHVEEIQRRLGAQRELAEEAKMHAENIDKLKRRWEGIQKSLLDIRNMMNLLEDKENFYKNLEVIQNEINEKHAWKDKMLTDRPTNNQLIHLRNKIRSMRQYEVRLKELNAQSIILLTKALPKSHKDEIEADTKRINDAFEELFTHLSKREVEIKLALNKKPLEHHEDEYSNVKRRIEEMQSGLISEHAMLSTSDVVEKKLAELYKMKRDFDGLQTSYDNAIRDRKQNYERGSVEELNMRSSVENLVTRFHDSRAILAQKISKLEKGKELLESFESNMREVNQYVERVEEFVKTHTALPHGDVTELEKLVIESNNLDEEKKKYKTEIETIVRIRDEILEDCDDALAKTIKNDVKDLQKRFEITNESFKLNESLRRSLEKSENVFRRIAEIEKWLEVIENEIPKEDECAIRDSGELYQMKTRFQTLKDKCDEKTTEFRSLNEAGNDILLAAEQGAGGVARRLTHLNALWTRVTHCIYERYNTERVERIEAIGRQLIEAHIMPQWIQAEIDNIAHRFNDLNEQAQGRIRELEAAAKEAARSEVYIDNIHQWILQLKTRERSRDLPDEKQLTSEWESQRAVLRTVEEQRKLDEVREQYLTKRDAGNEQQQDQSEQRIEIRLQRAHDSLLERFYRTLSEIKSEVESIIKSGRKMVEEKTVPEPQEFSKKIDSLKELYNKLGAHVTESKSRLETALLTAREIQNDLQSLMSWLQGLGNVGKQTLELEMSRMEAIKDKLNANYVEFSKICEPMYLGNLREQIDNINERWEHLKRHGLGKKETELEVLQRYLNDIDQELESPETMTVAKLKLLKTEVRAKASEVDAMDNKALTKQWERIVEKITVRVSASDFDDKKPTATSTPIKDEKSKKQVQVVAMSPKPNQEVDDNRDEVVPKLKLTMSPLLSTKSYIPISKEKKLHNEKYQRTDDNSQVSENNEPPESPDASSTIRSRFGSACDTEVEQFEIAAQKMARRLHVMLLTLGGVASERDPAKRLEILKNQLGAIAPDAAALISRGDSLVYAKHKENPQMAEYLQTHFQDKLRNKWSMVMSEIESKRNAAIKAEDDVKELTGLIEKLQKWVKEYKSGDVVDGENDCERIQELVRELKAQRVAYPERAAADVCTAFNCVRDAYDAALPKKDKKGKDTEGNEAVTRINRAREAVASVMTALRSHPLNGRDYDDFPMQEDALSRIKSSMSEAGVAVEEAENSRRRASSERVKRVADKLRDEWSSLQTAWSSCQTNWAALYAALERDGESLDSLEGDIDTMDKQDVKLLNEFQEKLSEVERNVRDTVNAGAAVVRACGGALARDVLEQLDALRDRLAALTDRDAEELLRGQTKNADYIKNIRDELQQSPVKEKETEIREVIENYNNIERECVAAKQTVSPEVRERVLKLKEDWGFIRNACERETSRASPVKREEDRKSESPVTGNLRCIEFFIVVYLLYSRIFLH
ncbi:unnamed protein product [Leptidea sinapis]|uniref:Calponin-homology (CH) domain-containing protein n=1 Tax=Leptidea sinapis TaxID=189913 RepID=A0A5E4QCN5_9NEOP|nr:unnamed protein product [Leptidea sinapis]